MAGAAGREAALGSTVRAMSAQFYRSLRIERLSRRERDARRRVRRIRVRDHWPFWMWIVLALLLSAAFTAVKLAEFHEHLHHSRLKVWDGPAGRGSVTMHATAE